MMAKTALKPMTKIRKKCDPMRCGARMTCRLCVAVLALCLVACGNVPQGIIGKSKMEKLLADLYTADAISSSHSDQFAADSDRVALKRAVFEKYGVTQHDYDTSIIWYAQNVDEYQKVMKQVISILQDRNKDAAEESRKAATVASLNGGQSQHKLYGTTGDTANVWPGAMRCQLLPVSRVGYMPFELKATKDCRPGDRYALDMKLVGLGTQFTVFLAVDYSDGSMSFVNRNGAFAGWLNVPLQCDRNQSVRRLYGYVRYQMQPLGIAYIDSVQLLRTRFDESRYSSINTQRFMPPKSGYAKSAKVPDVDKLMPSPSSSSSSAKRTRYKPKSGVNKSGSIPASSA